MKANYKVRLSSVINKIKSLYLVSSPTFVEQFTGKGTLFSLPMETRC